MHRKPTRTDRVRAAVGRLATDVAAEVAVNWRLALLITGMAFAAGFLSIAVYAISRGWSM